ncbi:MAG: hypothetical protein JKY14_03120 [Paraglaciecola sp.]|nr:hypothetical protein [Paraglaciecola sp.]
MKIAFIGLIICFFNSTFLSSLAVAENNLNPDAEKFVLNTSVQYLDNYHPSLSDGIIATAFSAGVDGQLLSMHESVWLQAAYSGAYTQFKLDETELDLDDKFSQYEISLLGRFFMGNRWYVDLQGSHTEIDYLLGKGIAKFRPATLTGDSESANKVAASLVYGNGINSSDSRESKKFIWFGFSRLKQDYADKNDYSNLFDLTRDEAELGLSIKLSDITQFETSLQFENVDFVDDSQLDNTVYRLLLGFEWQGTGQTRFKLLVGGYRRVYQLLADNQGLLAELDAVYAPQSNLSISLKGSQATATALVENALDTIIRSVGFSINYAYKEHVEFVFRANVSHTQYEQIGADQTSAERAIGLTSNVSIYDYSTVSLVLQRESLDNDFLSMDYVQNKVELKCRYAF